MRKKVYVIMDGAKVHLIYGSKKEAEKVVKYCNENLNSGYSVQTYTVQ